MRLLLPAARAACKTFKGDYVITEIALSIKQHVAREKNVPTFIGEEGDGEFPLIHPGTKSILRCKARPSNPRA